MSLHFTDTVGFFFAFDLGLATFAGLVVPLDEEVRAAFLGDAPFFANLALERFEDVEAFERVCIAMSSKE